MNRENFDALMTLFHKGDPLSLAQRQMVASVLDEMNEDEIAHLKYDLGMKHDKERTYEILEDDR